VAWAAVRAVAATERRTGLRALLLFGVLFGLVAGLVLGTVALGARTAGAYPRLTDAVDLDDVRVQVPVDQPGLVAAVPTLPDVRTAWMTYGWVARVEGPALRFVSLGAGLDQPPDLVRPVVVEGRAPAPDAADEVMISEPLAEASDLRVGTAVTVRILTLDQIARFGSGVGDPKGPILRLWVVGIARMPAWGGPLSEALTSPAFAQRYRGTAASRPAFVRLDDTPGAADRFAQAYAAAAAEAPPSQLAALLPPRVYRPRADGDPAARAAERILVVGLTIFAAVLAAGGLLVVGQGLLRHHAAHRASQEVERALGLTPGERVAARLGAAAPAAVVAAVLAGAIGMAAGTLQPLGSQARFEPEPGFRAPWEVAVGGRWSRRWRSSRWWRWPPRPPDDAPAPPPGPPAPAARPGPRWGPRRSSGCAWPCGATAARWRCRPGPPWQWRASSPRSRSARASRCCCPIRCARGMPPTSRWRTPRRSTWPSWSATPAWRRCR